MTAILLSLILLCPPQSAMVGKATWYGYTGEKPTHCYGGFKNTCSPYLKRKDGGWHDETVNYCAVPSFRYRDEPYWVLLTNVKNGKTTTCLVRDHCACTSGGIIDLSPAVFLRLAKTLAIGWVQVKVMRVAGGGR